jgi:hypothetical protein
VVRDWSGVGQGSGQGNVLTKHWKIRAKRKVVRVVRANAELLTQYKNR